MGGQYRGGAWTAPLSIMRAMASQQNSEAVDMPGCKAFHGAKTLVFGLGILGGGVATTNWLIQHGADVTVTDLKDRTQFAPALRRLQGEVRLRWGGHREDDIGESDIVIFNPDIPVRSPWVALALRLNKRIENEATLFYRLCKVPIVAITGTRGKTTTTSWTKHFITSTARAVLAGNSPGNPFLATLARLERISRDPQKRSDSKPLMVVNELPSYHLEYLQLLDKGPDVAVITNVSPDHLNRHPSMEDYVDTKAKIFSRQTPSQHLILNFENKWTGYILRKPRPGKTWLFAKGELPGEFRGVYYANEAIYFRHAALETGRKVLDAGSFVSAKGGHNLENLLASVLAAHLAGVPWTLIQRRIHSLPQIPFRQQVVFEDSHLAIVNDNAATSPEGSIAAIRRFGGESCLLITGGTDRDLDYGDWAPAVKQFIRPGNLIFLAGSATRKMVAVLGDYVNGAPALSSLAECFDVAIERAGKFPKATIVFSPGAKSFEKYRNEFERGRDINRLIKREANKWIQS